MWLVSKSVWFPHSDETFWISHFFHCCRSYKNMLVILWIMVENVSFFIVQPRIDYNKVIKYGIEDGAWKWKKKAMVRVSYGPLRSSQSLWWIGMHFYFFFSSLSSWHEEENVVCFLTNVQFSFFHFHQILFDEPSNHQTEDLEAFWLSAEAPSWCRVATPEGQGLENRFVGKKREYTLENRFSEPST